MAELSKNDILISDLSAIETQLSILLTNNKDLQEKNIQLEEMQNTLKKENALLLQKLSALENEIKDLDSGKEANLFNSLNSKEKENLKLKLQNLISRLDYHLSS